MEMKICFENDGKKKKKKICFENDGKEGWLEFI